MFTIKDYISNQYNSTRRGILFTPDDISPGEKIPLIIFLHGKGEAGLNDGKGNGAAGTEYMMYWNGSPLQMAKDGTLGRFAVLGLQGIRSVNSDPNTGWAVFPYEVAYIAKSLQASYSGICITGLSAGGETTLEAINTYPGLFQLGFALSPAAMDINTITSWVGRGLLLASHGKDDTVTNSYTTSTFVDKINSLIPGSAVMQYTAGGHSSDVWVGMYNTTVVTIAGKSYKWQDLLTAKITKPDLLFITKPITGGITTATMIAIGKAVVTNGSGVFDSTDSVGAKYARWDFSGGISAVDGFPIVKQLGFKPNTVYTAFLNIWDINLVQASAKYLLSIDSNGNGSFGNIVVMPAKTIVNIITTTVYKDAAGIVTTDTIVK